jgi:hypothetical protein
MSVLAFFQWCEGSSFGAAVRGSRWIFPFVEAGHLLALTVFGAAVLIVDLRLWNMGLHRRPLAEVGRSAQPLLVGGLFALLITGCPLFAAEASRYYYNAAFWYKAVLLFCALVFTFTVRRSVVLADGTGAGPVWNRLVGVVSLALWAAVGIGGKAVGFY